MKRRPPTSDPNLVRIILKQIPDNTLSIELMLLADRYGFLVCCKMAAFRKPKRGSLSCLGAYSHHRQFDTKV